MTDITKVAEKLLPELLCSICKNYLSVSPILINEKGENTCGRCKNTKCQEVIRNIFYEILARGFQFPCQFTHNGCSRKLIFNDVVSHEEKCPFRTCQCKVDSCKWSGSIVELIIHYDTVHKNLILRNDEAKQVVEGYYDFLFTAYDYHFLLEWNCSDFNLQIRIKPLDIYSPDIDIMFICRLFSSDAQKPSLGIDSVGLNIAKILPLSKQHGEKLPSLLFSIHTLVPEEFIVTKIENLKKLRCPQCSRQMALPIFTCPQNHICCVDCAGPDCNFCTNCQEIVIFSRFLELELIAVSSLYRCRWQGCGLQFCYKNIRAHEQSCLKRKYSCLYCFTWQGNHDEFIKHDKFCRSKFIFCPMSSKTEVAVLGIRTGELQYLLLAYRELFEVSFLLKNDSAEVTVVNFGPASLLSWYQFEADMEHVIDFNFPFNQTHHIVRTTGNQYKLHISTEQIAQFGGKEFYKLTVRIIKTPSTIGY